MSVFYDRTRNGPLSGNNLMLAWPRSEREALDDLFVFRSGQEIA